MATYDGNQASITANYGTYAPRAGNEVVNPYWVSAVVIMRGYDTALAARVYWKATDIDPTGAQYPGGAANLQAGSIAYLTTVIS